MAKQKKKKKHILLDYKKGKYILVDLDLKKKGHSQKFK